MIDPSDGVVVTVASVDAVAVAATPPANVTVVSNIDADNNDSSNVNSIIVTDGAAAVGLVDREMVLILVLVFVLVFVLGRSTRETTPRSVPPSRWC